MKNEWQGRKCCRVRRTSWPWVPVEALRHGTLEPARACCVGCARDNSLRQAHRFAGVRCCWPQSAITRVGRCRAEEPVGI
jgi:hypothetical protein